MNERELIPGITEPKLNELLKSYGVRLVVIHDESNTEHEPEKLLEMIKTIMIMDFKFEVKEIA